jgi:hypothetical protein
MEPYRRGWGSVSACGRLERVISFVNTYCSI